MIKLYSMIFYFHCTLGYCLLAADANCSRNTVVCSGISAALLNLRLDSGFRLLHIVFATPPCNSQLTSAGKCCWIQCMDISFSFPSCQVYRTSVFIDFIVYSLLLPYTMSSLQHVIKCRKWSEALSLCAACSCGQLSTFKKSEENAFCWQNDKLL